MIASQLRGPDSTGFGVVYKSKDLHTKYMKSADDATAFLGRKDVGEFFQKLSNPKLLMGHTRYATHGSVNTKNAHPFVHEHIMLAHNGVVTNKDTLINGKSFDVDSEAMCHSIAHTGALETLRKVNGDWALTYYDTSKSVFNIIRNYGRQLYMTKNKHRPVWYYASEAYMLYWLLNRNTITFEEIKIIPEHTLLTYDMTADELAEEKVDCTRKIVWNNPNRWPSDTDTCDFPQGRSAGHQPADSHSNSTKDNTEKTGTGTQMSSTQGGTLGQALSQKRDKPGPEGHGLELLAKWGLSLGDVVEVYLHDWRYIRAGGVANDFCTGTGYLTAPDQPDVDLEIFAFKDKDIRELEKLQPDKCYFTKIAGCWYTADDSPSKGRYRLVCHTLGIGDTLAKQAVVPILKEKTLRQIVAAALASQNKDSKMPPALSVIPRNPKVLSLPHKKKDTPVTLVSTIKDGVEVLTPEQVKAEGRSELEDMNYMQTEVVTSIESLVDGPHGKLVTFDKWLGLTSSGCSLCSCNLVTKDTRWVGDDPLCVKHYHEWTGKKEQVICTIH